MTVVQASKAYYPVVGGIEKTITILSEGLKKNNIDVEVLVCNSEYSFFYKKDIIHSVPVHLVPKFGSFFSLPFSPTYMYHLQKMEGDILHIHEPFPWGDIAVNLLKAVRKNFSSIVVTWHSDIVRQKWVMPFYRSLLMKFLDSIDLCFVSSPQLIDSSEFLTKYRNKCVILPLGVELEKLLSLRQGESFIHSVNKIRRKHETPLVLFVGRLVYYKGVTYLIEAMKDLSDCRLIIIGDGPLKSELFRQITTLHLSDRVTIVSSVSDEELAAYYEACDIFVLPSVEKSEAYGLVQIEAMAFGKPVICTELGTGTSFINQNGITGFVVPPRNSDAIKHAIRQLLDDHTLRTTMGSNARKRSIEEFSAETMVNRTILWYKKLMEKKY